MPNPSRSEQNEAFHAAIVKGDVLAMAASIQAGANINDLDSIGLTALMVAAYKGDMHMVAALLSLNADEKIINQYGFNAADYAIDSGSLEMFNDLVREKAELQKKRNAIHIREGVLKAQDLKGKKGNLKRRKPKP